MISLLQLHWKQYFNDNPWYTPTQFGGHATIHSKDGYHIPLCFCQGLPYIRH